MGLLDDAIREHLELMRRHGAADDQVQRLEQEALSPVRRRGEPEPAAPLPERPLPADVSRDDLAPDLEPDVEAALPLDQPVMPEPAGHEPRTETIPSGAEPPPPAPDDEPYAVSPAETPGAVPVREPEPEPEPESEPGDKGSSFADDLWLDDDDDDAAAPPADLLEPPDPATAAFSAADVADAVARSEAAEDEDEPVVIDEDVLKETPEFLEETPEHDRLWFEQRPPRGFDFDK